MAASSKSGRRETGRTTVTERMFRVARRCVTNRNVDGAPSFFFCWAAAVFVFDFRPARRLVTESVSGVKQSTHDETLLRLETSLWLHGELGPIFSTRSLVAADVMFSYTPMRILGLDCFYATTPSLKKQLINETVTQ